MQSSAASSSSASTSRPTRRCRSSARARGQGRHPRGARSRGRPVRDRAAPARRARWAGWPGRPRPRSRRRDLPSAVYGEARDAAGRMLGHVTPRLPAGETAPAAPRLPATICDRRAAHRRLGRAGRATASSPGRARRRARRRGDPAHGGRRGAVAAAADRGARLRRRAARARLRRLVDRARSACARWTRSAPRRARSPPATCPPRGARRAAHGGRPPRPLAQRDARAPGAGVRRAARERGAPAPLPRRRVARAAHAAVVDPRLRRAVPDRRRGAARGRREGDDAHRGRVGADGRARRGPARARAPGRGPRADPRAGRSGASSPATRSTMRAPSRRSARSRCTATATATSSSRATRGSCARCSPTCCATRSCTRRRERRSRCRCTRATGTRRSLCVTSDRGCRPTIRASSSIASGAPTRAAGAGARAPVSGWRSWRGSSPRTAAGRRRPTPTGGGARFEVVLPLDDATRRRTRERGRASLPPVLRKALRRRGAPRGSSSCSSRWRGVRTWSRRSCSATTTGAPRRGPARQRAGPGTFESAHPFAPYYVVPRKRLRDPSELSRVARNKIADASPRARCPRARWPAARRSCACRCARRGRAGDGRGRPLHVVSDARPLRGWFTALPGCMVEPVRRAQLDLDSGAPRCATSAPTSAARDARARGHARGPADDRAAAPPRSATASRGRPS